MLSMFCACQLAVVSVKMQCKKTIMAIPMRLLYGIVKVIKNQKQSTDE